MDKKKWDFVYDEEHFDTAKNFAGVLSNGRNYLFYHVYSYSGIEGTEYCAIYNSIFMTDDTLEVEYKWTPDNDSLLLDTLNKCGDNYCGDESPLRSIKFEEEQ